MQLDSLTLKNFKIHRDRTFQFKPGVNGIVGQNGMGKSTIIDAIRFVFTGQLDNTKEETITIGESEGYVRATFVLNSKRGSIERSLSGSKVGLRFDGKNLNKAGEVKDLWASLLQIDEHIFNNVIVARQGEIPLLFSGNDTVREKIFQKIFLVPATDKIRSIIWDHYIKTTPALLPTEDKSILSASIADLVGKRKPLQASMDDILSRTLNEATVNSVLTRITFLNKCIQDRKEKPALEFKHIKCVDNLRTTFGQWREADATYKAYKIEGVKIRYESLLKNSTLIGYKERAEKELKELMDHPNRLTDEQSATFRAQLRDYEQKTNKLTTEFAILTNDRNKNDEMLKKLETVVGEAHCPTCLQALIDIPTLINTCKQQRLQYSQSLADLQKQSVELYEIKAKPASMLVKHEDIVEKLKNCTKTLVSYKDVVFSQEEFQRLKLEVESYEKAKDTVAMLHNEVTRLQGQHDLLEAQLKGLSVYDGSESPETELDIMQQVLTVNKERKEQLNELKIDYAKLTMEINLLETRIGMSQVNEKKNEQRNRYFNTLNELYELFHVSRFPRKLIQSYSDVVQDYLTEHIQRFNIPYSPQIGEGFRIDMLDAEGRVVPSVSGGQKVMVGLCLRLALHSLFAQSFPMWIIDEGTTHLDSNNAKMYFELIKHLRKESMIKQVIIIDHDEMLADVVDNVIQI